VSQIRLAAPGTNCSQSAAAKADAENGDQTEDQKESDSHAMKKIEQYPLHLHSCSMRLMAKSVKLR